MCIQGVSNQFRRGVSRCCCLSIRSNLVAITLVKRHGCCLSYKQHVYSFIIIGKTIRAPPISFFEVLWKVESFSIFINSRRVIVSWCFEKSWAVENNIISCILCSAQMPLLFQASADGHQPCVDFHTWLLEGFEL